MVLDSIADGVFTVDKNFRITSFNKSAEQITGWTAKEVVGARCRDIFHSSICGDTCILAQSVKNGTPISSQSIFITNKSGHTIPINISAAPLTAPDGAVIGGVETFRDLTSVMTKDLVLESIADGVFTVDRNWRITSFNRAAEQITGWKQEDALGMSCANVFHSSICGENCAIAQSLYSGKPVPTRSIFIHDIDGQKIPISISAAPLLDHEGNVIGGVETFRDLSVVEELRKQLSKRYTFGEIISKSSAMQRIFDILPEIANSESNVLVLGESGTGKELVARAIQNSSRRSKKPFVAINCGALPENLLESELFGYKAGAFTDAKKDHPGRFAKADQGTLFLDEIGDISPALQVKLLRVLQEKVYEPLGSNEPIRADVRIIAATNRDLPTLVKNGTFREDLFYRLNIVKIMLPPLRERMEDIPILADHFAKQFSAQQGKDIVGVSDSALSILMRHDFPGNIRELQNIIEYAFILCHGGYIQPEHLPEPFAPAREDNISTSLCLNKAQPLDEIEKTAIFNALERNQWKKMTTCRELQISKDTLRRKIEKYGLKSNNEPTED
ncbi:MAG: sigma 54-interacting transcriptional regulator [Desulfobulbaceae bacterium]|nr:sigma 54-interacting transcriptional regulator [Desulfobulbaceae bacterium]